MLNKYIATDKPNTFLKVRVYYDKGGMNYFTSQVKRRGYYVMVTPIEKEGDFEVTRAFSGYCECVLEVPRHGLKAELAAEDLAAAAGRRLVPIVAAKNNLVVTGQY